MTWLRDVMGFSEYWRVHFHTADINPDTGGSGLASIVMWDPESGIKLANNEPVTPNYESSQIYTFVEANQGPGVQHVAFHVPAIAPAVENLRTSGIQFLDTPATYYDMLPERLARQRVTNDSASWSTATTTATCCRSSWSRADCCTATTQRGPSFTRSSSGSVHAALVRGTSAVGMR